MIDMINLWPEIETTTITPPVTILEQQASMLGNMTKNIILGDIKARESEEYDFSYVFYIIAPALSNYRYKLLTIYHNIDLYPIVVQVEENIYKEIDKPEYFHGNVFYSFKVSLEDKFLDILKAIFNSSKAKKVISALYAQSIQNYKAS
jgi:hypothetical protein